MQTLKPAEEVRHASDAGRGVIDVFRAIATSLESADRPSADGPSVELGGIVDRLDERAFGLLLLLLALPCAPPFVYVLPQIVSLPMLALAAQMAGGRQSPWLPRSFRARRLQLRELNKVLDFCEKYVRWFEAIARPRFPAITGRIGTRVVGALLLIPTVSILTPLPGTNTVPGIGVAITALGLVQRDGLLVVLGLVVGLFWVTALVVFATLFGVEFASFLKQWLGSMF